MITISKEFNLSSAHKLSWHKGKCKTLHGHNYSLKVFLIGKLDKNGIILDYYDLSDIVKKEIIDKYDHQYLNDFFENPTAELLAQSFLDILRKVNKGFYKVQLSETPKTMAEAIYEGE